MARKIKSDGEVVPEEESGGFDPIPAGEYDVYLFDVDERQFKEGGANEGREYYNIQLTVAEGQEFANRRIFTMVGLFPKWAPTAKNPDGSDNWLFFQLYAAFKGISSVEARKQFNKDKGFKDYPDIDELTGMLVTAKVGIRNNTYNGETTQQNTVNEFKAAGGKKANLKPKKGKDDVMEIDL